jgi:uncharacterized paraquat-inducible protein A
VNFFTMFIVLFVLGLFVNGIKYVRKKQVRDDIATIAADVRRRNDGKECPKCAETVKQAAQICRFCGHEFSQS